jgi:hypothetical protein
MTDYQFIYITVIIFQSLIVIILASIVWRQSYLTKKGQNQADKEDIAELTHLVENVKFEFIRENASVQADLEMLKDRKGKTYSESQQAIINFYTAYNKWLIKTLNTFPYSYTEHNYTSMDEVQIALDDLHNNSDVGLSIVDLLVSDTKIANLGNQLNLETIHLSVYIGKKLIEYKELILVTVDSLNKLNTNELIAEASQLRAKAQKSFVARKEFIDSFNEGRSPLYQKIVQLQYEFQTLCREYLNK